MPQGTDYAQIIRFAVAGAIGAGIEMGLFFFFVDFTGLHYLTGNFIAISVALLVNYIISQRWVFESGRYSKGKEFGFFVAVSVVALMLNQLLMWVMIDNMELHMKLSKILAIGMVAVYNYSAKKFFVFKG
ncbi:GtrA family protein [Nafulsella turpanensis]|uniref:GtrA family protein n=1 Tax=Nafulsella turpanensis TaxID=1265690 RepID=UPI00034893AD|nr:GtrA family protein [Nafulsella turpanensis]